MFSNFKRTPMSRDDASVSTFSHRKPFEELSNASTVELRTQRKAYDGGRRLDDVTRGFVETPDALRRGGADDACAARRGVRRTDDATPVSFTPAATATEEFDRYRAMTPYFGKRLSTPTVSDSVDPAERRHGADADRHHHRHHHRGATSNDVETTRSAVLEVLLWRDAARSAIHFTLGMAILLAFQVVPRSTVSGVSMASYAAMSYVAYKYVFAVMFPRLSYGLELNDRAVGDMAQRWAMSFNAFAAKHRGLLAGQDNTAVFRAFTMLYVTSSLGHVMSAWAVVTTLWVCAFTLPSVFETYRYPLTNAYVRVHVTVSSTFNALSAPKRWCGGFSIGIATFACVSLRARLCLSFLALVAFRMFRETHLRELEAFENIVRSAGRRMSRSMNEFAMIVSPVVRHRRR